MRAVGSGTTVGGRRSRPLRWLAVGALAWLLLELWVIIMVGRQIGALPTILLLVALSVLGAWLTAREGRKTARGLAQALRSGEQPSRQLADAILAFIGGGLLVVPGFISGVAGLLLVLPFTRPLFRPLLEASIARRLFFDLGEVRATPVPGGGAPAGGRASSRDDHAADEVIEGEIIDDD